ncbi:5-amino-6-(D-ribitylamino)uracil--L-tyrosine 4-hydroxyphenyl transferase CofH [Methyloligella sp. 2.7D]|uniref:5-amino-6-(D-ribitylamino)uracil--L-tyrosine 4-hydroxyphenyl transferase CofH n=1 Tax=unclassified Methyloligella TaxID=2625955 RepID=UPI00157C18C8|nr:5-amino-6-(D-ribitylamino)uracil--L-tyrosine 4-hydroxyphenyl transferase CofH [Methyloligella sp. GL2]QKP78217.1 5-amino-6-(D-ribitylamino)uracil--L-tyrosine 4-hydroxyphenyl transferase CofH [Methyloligella sp. GL2]
MSNSAEILKTLDGTRLSRAEAIALCELTDLTPLLDAAARRRDCAHGEIVSYSRKVFIPLTQLCRDVCHYCTFAHPPKKGERAFLNAEQVLGIAEAGRKAGCKEALFTLGDKPEMRYRIAREELEALGHETTLSYLAEMAALVLEKTGLLPHINPGLMDDADLSSLRQVSVSQGIMLESASERLCQKDMPHYGSPDKLPVMRVDTIRRAGKLRIPFTSGILIGIGETREERIDALLTLRDLDDVYGHIQEIIVQNFRPKPGTRMADVPAPSLDEHLWTIAVARLLFEPSMNIQAPPNLSPGELSALVAAGINDWGGVSPVTQDFVNPEAPWPHLTKLAEATAAAGKQLTERLAVYPAFAREPSRWIDKKVQKRFLDLIDGEGRPRHENWRVGGLEAVPASEAARIAAPAPAVLPGAFRPILAKAETGASLSEAEIVTLFEARGDAFTAVCRAADDMRRAVNGDIASFVVTRNINYTNICAFKCQFCAFSKGRAGDTLRGTPYVLEMDEVARRVREAWARGASEVCMQGGIHPSYTGETYLEICRTAKQAVPEMHIHAFSPLEVSHGATSLGLSVAEFLTALKEAGLSTLPGTAAEILDDEVRAILCPDKLDTEGWLDVVRTAHGLGLRTTSTIMFGHVERYAHWARHLLRIRKLQMETGGITEFVPLPFVHMEAPIYLRGGARPGPTFREAILMHAVARLVLYPHIANIQASWVKLGEDGVSHCLDAGANDLGGTLMDESISRSAGASHGQEMTPSRMEEIILAAGRLPRQRNTLYGKPPRAHRAVPELIPADLCPSG